MSKYLLPEEPRVRGWTKEFCREVMSRGRFSQARNSHARYVLLWSTVPRPAACPCGSPDVKMYSITGKYETPTDYIFECKQCHKARTDIVKYPGRPKGSRNKKTIAKEKKLSDWEKMCADAEKELYGSRPEAQNNI